MIPIFFLRVHATNQSIYLHICYNVVISKQTIAQALQAFAAVAQWLMFAYFSHSIAQVLHKSAHNMQTFFAKELLASMSLTASSQMSAQSLFSCMQIFKLFASSCCKQALAHCLQ
jgi:hypothetical protein